MALIFASAGSHDTNGVSGRRRGHKYRNTPFERFGRRRGASGRTRQERRRECLFRPAATSCRSRRSVSCEHIDRLCPTSAHTSSHTQATEVATPHCERVGRLGRLGSPDRLGPCGPCGPCGPRGCLGSPDRLGPCGPCGLCGLCGLCGCPHWLPRPGHRPSHL